MSHRVGDIVVIEEEPDDFCQQCGAFEETRQYGPGFSRICWGCAQKDKAGTRARMEHKLFGEPLPGTES